MTERATLTLKLEGVIDEASLFGPVVVAVLREYADAVERGEYGLRAIESFHASNGFTLDTIAGSRETLD